MTERVRRPWLPDRLAHAITPDNAEEFAYVVVDEKVGDSFGLTVSRWPGADELGRLRFYDEDRSLELGVSRDKLRAEVYRPLRLRREPRVGDVFAWRLSARGRAMLAEAAEEEWEEPLAVLFQGELHDLSREARRVAKLALYAMSGPPLSREQAERWNVDELVDHEVKPDARPAPDQDAT